MDISRKEFFQWSVVTGAAVAFAGCGIPPHQALVSQLELPEYRLPGEAKWFATTCQECAGGCGVSVRVIDGRAKKLEGIPQHPINHGKVCAQGQSSLQALYNPDRLTSILKNQNPSQDWNEVFKTLASQLNAAASNKGSMLWIADSLHGTTGALMVLLAERAGAKICVLDFQSTTAVRTAMKGLTGKAELPYYPIRESDYVVNFGSDFLLSGDLPVHYAWSYGEFRQGKNRDHRGVLVSFAPRMNLTVSNSDQWIPVRPGTEGWAALGLGNALSALGKKGWPGWATSISLESISKVTGVEPDIFERLAKRLLLAKRPLAVAGAENGSYSNGVWNTEMIQKLNQLLGVPVQSFEPNLLTTLPGQKGIPSVIISIEAAVSQFQKGKFESVWVLETNPRYLLPKKLDFQGLFSKVKNKVVFSPFPNETSLLADWVIPTQTWFETWGDRLIRGPFGDSNKVSTLYNLQQPVVAERPGSKALGDILLMAAKNAGASFSKELPSSVHELVKSHFPDESVWENMLLRAGTWDEASLDWELYLGDNTHPLFPPPVVKKEGKSPSGASAWNHLDKPEISEAVEPKFFGEGQVLIPFYSPALGDGSSANRPWMQELPDPLTTVTWTHWIELPMSLCKQMEIERGDVVRLVSESGALTGPAYPSPALHPDAVAVPVGQGHDHYGMFADHGENPLSILNPVWQEGTGELAWVSTRVKVEKVGGKARMTTWDERVNNYPKDLMPL